jgi:hypothetical protein
MEKKNARESKIEYLALPYMHENPFIMDFRAAVSDIIAADLMKQGRIIFAPISMCHQLAVKYNLPKDWAYWSTFDKEFIKVSGKLLVITLKGWKDSVGAAAEMGLANKYNIPIEYIDPEPYIKL